MSQSSLAIQNIAVNSTPKAKPQWLSGFINMYNNLSINNIEIVEEVYHNNIVFIDPLHNINGIEPMKVYFTHMYYNTLSCEFIVNDWIESGNEAAIYWKMTFCHRRLNHQKPVTVFGHSQLKVDNDKIIYHRDYFDVGELIYENIPVLGRIIRWLKRGASQ